MIQNKLSVNYLIKLILGLNVVYLNIKLLI
jgi:hypothetical protein